MLGAGADGGGCDGGLLRDGGGEIGDGVSVGFDGGEILRLADEIESAEGFPDHVGAGIEDEERLRGGNLRSVGDLPGAGGAGLSIALIVAWRFARRHVGRHRHDGQAVR